MAWGAVASTVAGSVISGAMNGGGSSGSTTSTATSEPWSGIQPFLLGSSSRTLKPGVTATYGTRQVANPGGGSTTQDGTVIPGYTTEQYQTNPDSDYTTTSTPGIYPESQRLYQNGQWSPDMQSASSGYANYLKGMVPGQINTANGVSQDLINGKYNADIQAPDSISGVGLLSAPSVSAQQVDPNGAFSSLGLANPTGALSQVLSGTPNNPYLQQMQQASIDTSMRGYNDAIQNVNQQVLPQLRSEAVAAGQYGGSRQGIAEGMVGQQLARNARDLGISAMGTGANLYGSAFQNAQNNMASTANNMAGLGLSNAQSNANRDLSAQTTNAGNSLQAQTTNANNQLNTQQFNANLGLQNNSQLMQNSALKTNNAMQGVNTMQASNQLAANGLQGYQGALDAGNQYNWQNLQKYAGIIQPGASVGGTQSQSTPYYSNTAGNLLGGGMTGYQLYKNMSNTGNGDTASSGTFNGITAPSGGFDLGFGKWGQ